jgi:hypothetical protein
MRGACRAKQHAAAREMERVASLLGPPRAFRGTGILWEATVQGM